MGLSKISDPQHEAIFDPRAIIWTTLVEVHKMKLHTKYQRPGPSGFRQEAFLSFQLKKKKSIFSSCDLDMQWTGPIWITLKED